MERFDLQKQKNLRTTHGSEAKTKAYEKNYYLFLLKIISFSGIPAHYQRRRFPL